MMVDFSRRVYGHLAQWAPWLCILPESNDRASLSRRLSRLVNDQGRVFPDEINKLEDISIVLISRDGLRQVYLLLMNEYISSIQPRCVMEIGQLLSHAANLQPNSVMLLHFEVLVSICSIF